MIQQSKLLSCLILLVCIVPTSFAFSPPKSPIAPDAHSHRSQLQSAPNQQPDTVIYTSIKHRLTFNSPPLLQNGKELPKLILISGGPGTGTSVFVMSLALEQGMLKSILNDTVRTVMRSYVPKSTLPPLHRSSYGEFVQTTWLFTTKAINHKM